MWMWLALRFVPLAFWVLVTWCGSASGMSSPYRVFGLLIALASAFSGKMLHLAGSWCFTLLTLGSYALLTARGLAPIVVELLGAPHWPTVAAYALAAAILLASARYGGEAESFLRAALADCGVPHDRLQQYGDHGRECRKGERA